MKRKPKKSNLKYWDKADIAVMEKAIENYEARISTLTDEGEIKEARANLASLKRILNHFKQTLL